MSTGARWVACSREVSYAASLTRHLAAPGALTTLCGATASHPEVWRGNTTKPQCQTCLRVAAAPTPIPADHPADGPRDEHGNIVHGPAEHPDWNARYRGYAFRQLVNTRDRMAAELERDMLARKVEGADLDRALARLNSYNTLIAALETIKESLK